MAHRTVHWLACLVIYLGVTSAKDQSRWSRQISSYTADISDWVPLSKPIEREQEEIQPQIKRQAVAEPRILSEPFPPLPRPTGFGQENFPSRTFYNPQPNRQLYLQSVPAVPTAPQNYLTEQGFGQSIRFGLSQPNFPLTQGFVAPPLAFERAPPPSKPRTQIVPPNQVQFPTQGLPLSSQPKPFNEGLKTRPEIPKFIDGYRVENASNNYAFNKKNPQSLQKIKFDNVDTPRTDTIPQNTKVEREEVQLLYVPLESLNRGQYNVKNPLTSPHLLNSELYSQGLPKPGPSKQTFLNEYQRIPPKPIPNYSNQNYFSDFNTQIKDDQVTKFSTISSPFPTLAASTVRPKKLKPHQPPLAIFMTKEMAKTNQVKVGDVLSSLKNVETIAVLDSVNPLNAPKVFIGPSSLPPPDNFVKFELPYLSNIENSENKLKQLPFFVAPLSYNTPQGFAKIPFPSPHVGSVVINSQIKDSSQQSPLPPKFSNPYTPSTYKPEYQATQKPSFSFFSTTAPNSSPVKNNYQSNYYSIEPQMVSSVRPPKQPQVTSSKPGSYFLSNAGSVGNQYNSNEFSNFPSQENFKSSEAIETIPPAYHISRRPEITTTQRSSTTTTTKPPSTYPSQLLETHNPYSINQAFHFSTPLDYHNYFDDIKQPQVTPGSTVSPTPPPPPPRASTTQAPEQVVTEKTKYHQQSTPIYLQNYSPEIHYDSKEQNWRYPVFNTNDYTQKTELSSQAQVVNPVQTGTESYLDNKNNEYHQNVETQVTTAQENHEEEKVTSVSEVENPPRYDQYNQYDNTNTVAESASISPSTTTTTTQRTALRTRGRPRYTTSRPDSYETSTRAVITRSPFRERKPLPGKRYEPNKITTEKPYKAATDSVESTTRYGRTRPRGRVQYKPTESDEYYDKKSKPQLKEDLAYQRDVLHQNYPVTLMERMSTVDVEAITEPASKEIVKQDSQTITETSDTENAYTNEKASISQQSINTESKEQQAYPIFTPRTPTQRDTSYVPKFQSSYNDEQSYETKSSVAPSEHSSNERPEQEEEDIYVPQTPVHGNKLDKAESNSFATEPIAKSVTEQSFLSYATSSEYSSSKQEETTTSEYESNQESHVSEEEENVVQTTPSYNRVRVRPGVIRQYHQASSTESSKTKDRKRPQSVTYRPAYERRRTTMRIEEIEADLKTKSVNSRTESQENRHPVYKPDPTTQSPVTSAASSESSTKRGQYRRRRPSYSYTPSTTEASSSTKKIYETKNRFRGRRPTEKPTDKPETQTEVSSSTVKNSLHSRYNQRLKLSDRYYKKQEAQPEVEDQAPNYSINVPKFAEPDQGWSPKVNSDSFKPFNPNNIVDDSKIATTERRSEKEIDLDIITARNDYDDILIPVTPATNRQDKKIAEIPPTLEAFVEQSKVTKSESSNNMSTFESMLEEVMKSLEEQDQDEYTKNVMKHKGGEIGEIPPERIISSGDNYAPKSTTITQQDATTIEPTSEDSAFHDEEENAPKNRRRGFWKKVKVRPVTTESIEFAESQYYPNTVNHLGHPISKTGHEKSEKKEKVKVTTYKPSYQFIKNLFESEDYSIPAFDDLSKVDKTNKADADESLINEESQHTTVYVAKEIQTDKAVSPGDLDLGTGSPDPTLDNLYTTEPTQSTIADRVDKFSFMDYLFGVTSEDNDKPVEIQKVNKTGTTTSNDMSITSAPLAPKIETTETSFMPEEISTATEEAADSVTEAPKAKGSEKVEDKTEAATEISVVKVESSSVSSFMSPANVVSTSMSTEVSHETEICFRGKCIKTSRDLL